MTITLIVFFALALIGGSYLAITIFQNKELKLSAVHIHGIIAIGVLISLGYHAFTQNTLQLYIAFGMLVMAAIGGLWMFSNHKKGNPGPKSAILFHAGFAVIAIVISLLVLL